MKKRIIVFDTTLRDGEQSPGASMSVEQKTRIAEILENLGVDRIEAGFPVSSPVQFEAVRGIAAVLKKTTVAGLARCRSGDIDAAARALETGKFPMLHLFIATSPLHRKFKLKMNRGQVIEEIVKNLEYARKYFDLIEFSAEDASRTEPDFLAEVVAVAIASGAKVINIPDTVGYAVPAEFGRSIARLRQAVPELRQVQLSVHCHNDLGLALANSIAALENGADQVEVTLNGIGERAGNCSLEELVMTLKVRADLLPFSTGVVSELLYPASKSLQSITGLILPRNKPIFGDNAFVHESGIHQDGVIKHRETYEIMRPADIGRRVESLAMGRHSGKHSFKEKLKQYDIKLSPEQFEKAFAQFTCLADQKKEVFDEDILSIINAVLGHYHCGCRLVYFHVATGKDQIPAATVKLRLEKQEFLAAATGDGPVDALFKAIDQALNIETRLLNYIVQAIGWGKDAQGQVQVEIEKDGLVYFGKGLSTDIIKASALAYLQAYNSAVLHVAKIKNKENKNESRSVVAG